MINPSTVGKSHCDVFTKIDVVKYMLDIAEYTSDRDLSCIRVIEPSCGEGEFAVEIVKRLLESSQRFNFDVNVAINNMLTFYDTDKRKIEITINRISEISDVLDFSIAIFKCEDFLLASVEPADVIIGNPPYIRNEQIAEEKKSQYRELFSTFKYRSDIYIPFFEKSLKALAPNGKHCFICSNRWFKNQYGRLLREIIAKSFNINYIIELEKANPFQENVIAYPAITLIENSRKQRELLHYAELNSIESLNNSGLAYQYRLAPKSDDWSSCFSSVVSRQSLSTIEDMGLKIGIGVATGADNIFIGDDLVNHIEQELLMPIITSRDIKGMSLNWSGKYIFNPFDKNGNIIDLKDYPKAQSYLLNHKARLQNRHIAKRNPLFWYRTIDKINSSLLSKPKILLADISTNTRVKIDHGEYYPHHNIYYITGSDIYNLHVLSAILMSDFIAAQLQNLSTKMNGGYPRWQSQYIKRLKMPNILHFKEEDKASLINFYKSNDISSINSLVNSYIN